MQKFILSACLMTAVLSSITTTMAQDPASPGLVLGPNDGEKLVRRWGYPFLIKVDPKNGGAQQFVVGEEHIPPGKSIQTHQHSYAEEVLIIMKGKGTATLGTKQASVGPGSLVFIPINQWVGLVNDSDIDLDLIWMFPKTGIEKYFRATSVEAGAPSTPLSQGEMDQIRKENEGFVHYLDPTLKDYTAK